jgi:hypothetical protein
VGDVLQRRQLRKFYIGSMVVSFGNYWLIRLDGAVQDRLQGIFATGTWIMPMIFGLSGHVCYRAMGSDVYSLCLGYLLSDGPHSARLFSLRLCGSRALCGKYRGAKR